MRLPTATSPRSAPHARATNPPTSLSSSWTKGSAVVRRPHWAEDLSPDSIVGFVRRDTFDFAPGTRWSYSNTGYMLLGMIIEKVTGKPYATYVDEEFFKAEDRDVVLDSIAAAINAAQELAEKEIEVEVAKATGGLKIPGL